MSDRYSNLQIEVGRWGTTDYYVELSFDNPYDIDEQGPRRGPARFDFQQLAGVAKNPQEYGRLLAEGLFYDPKVRSYFEQALARSPGLDPQTGAGMFLRLQIFVNVDDSDAEGTKLHDLHWETLRLPSDDTLLSTSERTLFSRFLGGTGRGQIRSQPSGTRLHALIVVSSPSNIDRFADEAGARTRQLTPLDVAGEIDRAARSLGDMDFTLLASQNEGQATPPSSASVPPIQGPPTLSGLISAIRQGCDILYLVCHGTLEDGEPWLWLEDDDQSGKARKVKGKDLATTLTELQEDLPRLVVLASCQSAGPGYYNSDEGALAAIGPRMAQASIPAVLAMQGNVSLPTVEKFMPEFFRRLQVDGQIDRAMASARRVVRDRADAWVPVLFMRLKTGNLWYSPGFASTGLPSFQRWSGLMNSINQGLCIPILGPEFLQPLLGSSRDLARRWAKEHTFPMSSCDRDELPQVAQYLAISQNEDFPRSTLVRFVYQKLLESKYSTGVPDELRNIQLDALDRDERREKLAELFSFVGAEWRRSDDFQPHKVLAALPASIYVVTTPDDLMPDALREAGREPQIEYCRWTPELQAEPPLLAEDYHPNRQHPLVYYAFGHLGNIDSVVLTEDNYFNYLVSVTMLRGRTRQGGMGERGRTPDSVLYEVSSKLAARGRLFLGFQMDDWGFRVLYSGLVKQEGMDKGNDYGHVAVQIDPLRSPVPMEPQGARRYLEDYFQRRANISIYWGGLPDFLKDLKQRM
jgi:hypothetical protein